MSLTAVVVYIVSIANELNLRDFRQGNTIIISFFHLVRRVKEARDDIRCCCITHDFFHV